MLNQIRAPKPSEHPPILSEHESEERRQETDRDLDNVQDRRIGIRETGLFFFLFTLVSHKPLVLPRVMPPRETTLQLFVVTSALA